MNKQSLIVPKGIRYISDWKEYSLRDYAFPHILNKTLTGCGFTEYCIRNDQNLVLVSPRRFLLENKEDQHQGEIFYARNDTESQINFEVDVLSVSKDNSTKKTLIDPSIIAEGILEFKHRVFEYCTSCAIRKKPFKILVTYDSFRHVKEILAEIGILMETQIVVDEFQSIFIDSRFKSHTELELVNQLLGLNRVCFVSATPMLDEYLDRLEEFKNLPYLEFDWKTEEPGRIKSPRLEVKFTVRSLNEEITHVIQSYLKGNYDIRMFQNEDGTYHEVISDQGVFFMNSVKGICQAIRSNSLTIDQCNILCAKTDDNEKKVKAAFNEVLKRKELPKLSKEKYPSIIGRIPKRGEPHKMFTFCTRTVYLGADFYSTCARTFIFSDSNIDCLSVDISMDLEQILGRQRLDENPWKDSASLFVKTTSLKNQLTKGDFDRQLDRKILKTKNLLNAYNESSIEYKHDLAEKYEKDTKSSKYKDDYVAVNHHAGSDLLPVFNNLMLVSEQRAFDVQQIDYKDRFTVFNTLQENEMIGVRDEVYEFAERFNQIKDTTTKLRLLVEFGEAGGIKFGDMLRLFNLIPPKYKDYYVIIGPSKIRTLSYKESEIKQEWNRISGNSKSIEGVISKVRETFKVGERYTKAWIKEKLREIYTEENYKKTPKATDLSEWFDIKKVYMSDKKNGFEIIKEK